MGHIDEIKGISRIEGMDNISRIRSGCNGFSTLWIKHDGSLYVNGNNDDDQLGLGDHPFYDGHFSNDVDTPTPWTRPRHEHSNLKCIDGASSTYYNILICDDGSAWFAGRLSDGDRTNGFIRLFITQNIVGVAFGDCHALFLSENGMVFDQGLGKDEDKDLEPVHISFFKENEIRIQIVRCGENHSLALSDDHAVYGWGDNAHGQCGVSDGENRDRVHIPEQIKFSSGSDIVRIECGSDHSGCVSADNLVFLWGDNEENECCVEKVEKVWTPQCVNEYVLGQTNKKQIKDFFLGCWTTMFSLQ